MRDRDGETHVVHRDVYDPSPDAGGSDLVAAAAVDGGYLAYESVSTQDSPCGASSHGELMVIDVADHGRTTIDIPDPEVPVTGGVRWIAVSSDGDLAYVVLDISSGPSGSTALLVDTGNGPITLATAPITSRAGRFAIRRPVFHGHTLTWQDSAGMESRTITPTTAGVTGATGSIGASGSTGATGVTGPASAWPVAEGC